MHSSRLRKVNYTSPNWSIITVRPIIQNWMGNLVKRFHYFYTSIFEKSKSYIKNCEGIFCDIYKYNNLIIITPLFLLFKIFEMFEIIFFKASLSLTFVFINAWYSCNTVSTKTGFAFFAYYICKSILNLTKCQQKYQNKQRLYTRKL